MKKPKGRPPLADGWALRRIAEHIVEAEERGERCSIRAAILRTDTGRASGNSLEAVVRRLQRKWCKCGQILLAETRERRAKARQRATAARGLGLPSTAKVAGLAGMAQEAERLRRALQPPDEFRRMLQLSDEFRRMFEVSDEVRRTLQSLADLRQTSDRRTTSGG